jgi:hypothetical protein
LKVWRLQFATAQIRGIQASTTVSFDVRLQQR